jgi:hypothetical protein
MSTSGADAGDRPRAGTYEPPKLIFLGSLDDLTAGGSPGANDANIGVIPVQGGGTVS